MKQSSDTMLRRLRRKIIWINVLLCGILLFGIFTAVCANAYRTAYAELEAGLRLTMERTRASTYFTQTAPNGERPNWLLYAYTVVQIDKNGTILSSTAQNMEMSDELLARGIAYALGNESSSGIWRRESLMYIVRTTPSGTRIAFTGTASITSALWMNIAVSAAMFIGAIAVIVLISFGLSVLAVRPVETAWTRQKQFIADASHELKTPLTVILANTDILLSHPDESVESQRQWISSTDEEARSMRRLVEQMLELARSEAEENAPVLTEVDLSALAEGCALCLEPAAYEKNMRIDCAIEPGIILVSDGERLSQLCRILLDNAMKHGAHGTEILFSLCTEGKWVTMRVQNSGRPIPAEDLPHIFDRFYRTDKARGEGGFGLGLAIARSTARSLGGEITVESDEENGTVFTVTLPR